MRSLVTLLMLLCSTPLAANVTGSDLQNFNATTNGLDFVTVHSSETLIPGIANFGLFLNYAVNTLPRYQSDTADARSSSINDSILANDFNFGLGITKTIDIGISVPSIVYQNNTLDGSRGEFENTGVTEIRSNLKWRFLGDSDGGLALVGSINQNLTQNNPYAGSDPGPILNLEFVADILLYKTALAINIGYRKRNPGDPISNSPIEPLEDQVIASTAVSQLIPFIDTKVIFEIFIASPVKETSSGSTRDVSASEALLGFKYDFSRNIAVHIGGSTEMSHGTASPDWRVYTGINYVTGNYSSTKVKLTHRKKPKRSRNPSSSPSPKLPTSLSSKSDSFPPEPPGIGDDVFVLRDVNFAFDSAYQVVAGAKSALDALANHLERSGYKKIIIEGHTDSIGSEDYNIGLGRRRAETIKQYLVKAKNLDESRIKVLTYGEFRPVADNGNYQGRQINRRVVFRIVY